MTNQISQSRSFVATERFTQRPIKLTVARPNYLRYALDNFLRLFGL